MAIYYCGVDLSVRNTGIAVVEYLGDKKFRLITKKSLNIPNNSIKGLEARCAAFELFKFAESEIPAVNSCKFFVFENYSFGSNGRITDLAELAGMYKYYISSTLKKPVETIAVQSVKRLVGGKGSAQKIEVQNGLKDYLVNFDEFSFNNFDESDAAAVAVGYGLMIEESIQSEQRENNEAATINAEVHQ